MKYFILLLIFVCAMFAIYARSNKQEECELTVNRCISDINIGAPDEEIQYCIYLSEQACE